MKKDIEWAKNQIDLRDTGTTDESDPQFYVDTGLRMALDFLDQLDEPEVLSQEFINEKAVEIYADTADAEVHAVFRMRDLQNLLVPKRELAVVPQEVADWYENHKDNLEKQLQGIAYNLDKHGTMPVLNKVDDWINKTEKPLQTLASLSFGYEVKEEEQKYCVLDSEDIPLLERVNNQTCKTTTGLSIYEDGRDNSRFELTEQEIKGYDERYWPFAVKVEELEE